MSRVIFLDIDGVLNSDFWNDSHQREISDGTLVDEEKIRLLAGLVKRTGAKIVLHSGWRYWFDRELKPQRPEAENLRRMLERENLAIEDITPDHSTEEIRRDKTFSLVKASEILAYLAAHEDVESWVVLDDLDLHSAEIEARQIRTNPGVGLTPEDISKAEKLLH